VLDGLPGIAEQVTDRDLMKEDLAGPEDRSAQQFVVTELTGRGLRLGEVLPR
jgi:hypothetical protein